MRAKFASVDANLLDEQKAIYEAGRDAVGRALVTRFEGLCLHKWSQADLAKRLQEHVTKMTSDAKAIGFAQPSQHVHPVLWKAVSDAIAT
jgi:hypothetical protein